MSKKRTRQVRQLSTLLSFILGVSLCVISLAAELLGLDLTPGFGIVQMFQLLIGLTLLTFAIFMRLKEIRPDSAPHSLQADIGVRLAATGLIFAYVSGLSDLIGIGTHIEPAFERPFVGPLQLGGLGLGALSIIIGLLLYYTSRGSRDASSLEFLVTNEK